MPKKFHRDQNAERQNAESQNAERQNAESLNAERQNAERQNAENLKGVIFKGQSYSYSITIFHIQNSSNTDVLLLYNTNR